MTGAVHYDRATARTYARTRTLPPETAALWVDTIRRVVRGRAIRTVLDLGCGAGRFTTVLRAGLDGVVLGIDASVEMLREARSAIDAVVGTRPSADGARTWLAAGVAEQLPVADARVDLALLSVVYHQFRTPATVVGELARALTPGGVVLVRQPALETHLTYDYLSFFPEFEAIDRERMPTRDAIVRDFVAGGFTVETHDVVRQIVARTGEEFADRIRHRAFSNLALLPDDVFAARLAEFEAGWRSTARDAPVWESIDLFVFCRRG